MDALEITEYIRSAKKKTPVKVYIWGKEHVDFPNCHVFHGAEGCRIVFGDWKDVSPVLQAHDFPHIQIENNCRNSALPLLDLKDIPARIEPGAIIREQVRLGPNAVIMMGAVINIGAQIGSGTMIDMGAILGSRVIVGRNCHIGAGAVLAGVLEPPSTAPVIIEDGVMVGANAVVLEGCRVGRGAVVAAGAVVTGDVEADTVAAGCPARIIKRKDEKTASKTAGAEGLRSL